MSNISLGVSLEKYQIVSLTLDPLTALIRIVLETGTKVTILNLTAEECIRTGFINPVAITPYLKRL